MPIPQRKLTQKVSKRGPKPTCDCEKCPKCINRLRQRRFYNTNRAYIKQGYEGGFHEITEGEWDEI